MKILNLFLKLFKSIKKQVEIARTGLENCFERDPDYKLWYFAEQGAFSDYDWQWNEEEKANYGTLKEREQ